MPAHIEYDMALWSPTPTAAQDRAMYGLFGVTDNLKILIMNVEAFFHGKGLKVCHEVFVDARRLHGN